MATVRDAPDIRRDNLTFVLYPVSGWIHDIWPNLEKVMENANVQLIILENKNDFLFCYLWVKKEHPDTRYPATPISRTSGRIIFRQNQYP